MRERTAIFLLFMSPIIFLYILFGIFLLMGIPQAFFGSFFGIKFDLISDYRCGEWVDDKGNIYTNVVINNELLRNGTVYKYDCGLPAGFYLSSLIFYFPFIIGISIIASFLERKKNKNKNKKTDKRTDQEIY